MDDDVEKLFAVMFSLLCFMVGMSLIRLKTSMGLDDSWWFVIVLVFIPAIPLCVILLIAMIRILWEFFCCWLKWIGNF